MLDAVDIEDEIERFLGHRRGGQRLEELAANVGETRGALSAVGIGHAVVAV